MKRVPVKKRRSKPRRGPMRSKAYRDWCAQQFCAIFANALATCTIFVPVDPAHTENNGMSSKGPDSSCVPLCRKHHNEYDAGRAAFEAKHGVDMKKIAAEHYERFLRETESAAVR